MFEENKKEFFNNIFKKEEKNIEPIDKKIDRKFVSADTLGEESPENNVQPGIVSDDEAAALEELKRIKKENPPFWVLRGKDFSPELDISKIPPGTARDILNRYKELAKKREPGGKEKRKFSDDE